MSEPRRVLLTGSTGFVGSHCYQPLVDAGFEVVCGTRRTDQARERFGERNFRQLDLREPASIRAALEGCDAALYLVHSMGSGSEDYERLELESAWAFREAAERAGLERLVFLGGVQPVGKPSHHLRSRLRTGECLREGGVPTVELRAAMIIGGGSESFRMVRDLAARLPWMLLPAWSRSVSEPIGIRDVAFALCEALKLEGVVESRIYDLPGPEPLSARDILQRTAHHMGRRPRMFQIPLVTPRLSSLWIQLITRADAFIASQLIEGLLSDLVCTGKSFWDERPGHTLESFDDAVRAALAQESGELTRRGRLLETLVRRFLRS